MGLVIKDRQFIFLFYEFDESFQLFVTQLFKNILKFLFFFLLFLFYTFYLQLSHIPSF